MAILYSSILIRKIIDEYIHNPRDRMIVGEKLSNNTSYEKLAEMAAVSPATVGRVLRKWRPVILAIYEQEQKVNSE